MAIKKGLESGSRPRDSLSVRKSKQAEPKVWHHNLGRGVMPIRKTGFGAGNYPRNS